MSITNLLQTVMRLKAFLADDESAVSPVIGVILMVAITVILAAVIASFVLGLGPSDAAPTTNFGFQNESGNDEVIVTAEGGDTVIAERLSLSGDNVNVSGGTDWTAANGDTSATVEGESAVRSSDTAAAKIQDTSTGWSVEVVWTSEDGGQSSTLADASG